MKIGIIGIVIGASITSIQTAHAQTDSDTLQNITAVASAPTVCGFTLNQSVFEAAVIAGVGDPSKIAPGGEYYPEIEANVERIKGLIQTDEGRASYCSSVKAQLSAFFD